MGFNQDLGAWVQVQAMALKDATHAQGSRRQILPTISLLHNAFYDILKIILKSIFYLKIIIV